MQQAGSLTFDLEFLSEFKKWEDGYRAENKSDPASDLRKAQSEIIRSGIKNSMYQQTLRELMESGVPGISASGQQPQAVADLSNPWWGELSADDESDVHDFAVLRTEQYEKGMTPIVWDEYQKNKPNKAKAAVDGFIINATTMFEGLAGGIGEWVGSWTQYGSESQAAYADKYGISREYLADIVSRVEGGSGMFGRGEVTRNERQIYDKYQAESQEMIDLTREAMGNQFKSAARTVVDAVTPNWIGLQQYRDVLVGSDPANPRDIRETYGRAGGGAIVTLAEMTGSAVGSIPYSIGALSTRNPRLAAALTSPFYGMGHSEAWNRRMAIYEEQLAESKALGTVPPVRPSLNELNAQSRAAGAIEFGSEFVGDRLQVALPAVYNWSRSRILGKAAPPSSAAQAAAVLRESMTRRSGLSGLIKTGAVVAAGGLIEGLEEAVPEIGKEITDPFFVPKGYENDFWSMQTAEAVGTGGIAGILVGSAQLSFGKESRARRRRARDLKKAAGEFAPQFAGAVVDKANRLEKERLASNSHGASTPAMAQHQLEEIGNGRRFGMFVRPESEQDVLTEDVLDKMQQIGVETKPIGQYNGMNLYAMPAFAEEMATMAAEGRISELTGHGELMEPALPMIGALVVRNKAGQAVEVIPYSSTALAEAELPALQHAAALSKSTVENVGSDGLVDLSIQIGRQLNGELESRNIVPPSRRPLPNPVRRRGVGALRLDILKSATTSKREAEADSPFRSSLLTAEEINGAKNEDVDVDVEVSEVPESQMSDGERMMVKRSNGQAVIVDAKVVFRIKRPDGSVDTYEKPTANDGGYDGQVSVDGLFLIRENGTAFTRRNAVQVAMHELRHRMVGRSPAAAAYAAKLLYLDPAFALRGGVEYMKMFESERAASGGDVGEAELLSTMDEPSVIAYYAGMHQAALSVLADEQGYADALRVMQSENSTQEQRDQAKVRIDMQRAAEAERGKVERFAEESIASTQTNALGLVSGEAMAWNLIYKDTQERSMRAFIGWMANVLEKNGFSGVYARQAIEEVGQILSGYSEDALQLHRRVRSEVEEKYAKDMKSYVEAKNALAPAPAAQAQEQQAQEEPPQPSEPKPGEPGYVGEMRPANVGVRPKGPPIGQEPSTTVGTRPKKPFKPSGMYDNDVAYSLRGRAPQAGVGAIPGTTDDDLEQIGQRISDIRNAEPEQRASLLASALGSLANLIPTLTQTQAQLAGRTGSARTQGLRYPGGVPGARAQGVAQAPTVITPEAGGMTERERVVSERMRGEGMFSLRGLTAGRVEELSRSGQFLDDRGYGPHQHPVDKSEDLDEAAPVEVAKAADVPNKYLASPESMDYLLGAIEHVAGAKTNTVAEYYDFIGRMREAAGSGLATADDFVIAAKRLGYAGFPSDLALETQSPVTVEDVEKTAGFNYSLRPDQRARWERESKAVDGEYLTTVYHGTPTSFERFDADRMGATSRPVEFGAASSSAMQDGIWFTDQRSVASEAAGFSRDNTLLPKIAEYVNRMAFMATVSLPEDVRAIYERNTGKSLNDNVVDAEGIADSMDMGIGYEDAIRQTRDYLEEMFERNPMAVSALERAFDPQAIKTVAKATTESFGTVAAANLYMANPLEVSYDPARGAFVSEADAAIQQMAEQGNDGLIMRMPDGERRYFVPSPRQVAIEQRASDAFETGRMDSMRRSLRGEYWIKPGGEALYADIDNDDMSHEMYAIQEAQYDFANWLGNRNLEGEIEGAEGLPIQGRDFADSIAQEFGVDEANDDWLKSQMDERNIPEAERPAIQRMFDTAIGQAVDAREYGLGKGWARVQGNNLQFRGLNDSILKDVADAVYEIMDEDALNQEFTVEDLNTGRIFEGVPFEALDKGVRGLVPYRGDIGMRSMRRGKLFPAVVREIENLGVTALPAKSWKERIRGLVNSGKIKQAEVDWSSLMEFLETPGPFYMSRGEEVPKAIKTGDILEFLSVQAVQVRRDSPRHDDGSSDRYRPYTLRPQRPDTIDSLDYRETVITIPVRAYPGYAQVPDVASPAGMQARQEVFDKYKPQLDELERRYQRAMYEEPYASTEEAAEERAALGNEREGVESLMREEANSAYSVVHPSEVKFTGPHFKERNIVAHVRTTRRTGPGYGRILFVEEIQSDWAQRAKKEGFSRTYDRDDLVAEEIGFLDDLGRTGYRIRLSEKGASVGGSSYEGMLLDTVYALNRDSALDKVLAVMNDPYSYLQYRLGSRGMQRAPFIESTDAWVSLALKEIMLQAVEGEFDSVAFISGQQSAGVVAEEMQKVADRIVAYRQESDESERYPELDDNVDVRYDLVTYSEKDRSEPKPTFERRSLTPSEMKEILGDEIGKQMMDGADAAAGGAFEMKTEGMTVGDRGLKKFYDEIVPAAANKLLKKFANTKVKQIAVSAGNYRTLRTSHLGFDVTDELARSIGRAGGLPMFSLRKGGPIEAAKALAQQKGVEATRTLDEFFGTLWPKLLKQTGRQLKASPRNFKEAARRAVSDIAKFIKENPKYQDYYETDWKVTRDLLNEHFGEEISDDDFALFRVIAGLTSPNTALENNLADTVNLFDLWRSAGSFDSIKLGPKPETGNIVILESPFMVSGVTNQLKIRALKAVEMVINEKGSVAAAMEYFHEPVTVKELHEFKKTKGYKSGVGDIGDVRRVVKEATGQDTLIPRMFIFGAKVGAYSLNATGDSRYTTVDIWESRFIRSYFHGMFAKNVGLPEDAFEHELFTSFSRVFNEELEKELGIKLPPSALQAVRWFYILDAARKAGYRRALTNETISGYTERALNKLRKSRGTDPEGGPAGPGSGRRGVQERAEGQVASDSKAEAEGLTESMMSMRRGLPGVKDEAVLRYIDRYDELRRMVDVARQSGNDIPDVRNPYYGARLLSGRLGSIQQDAERRYAGILRGMSQDGVTLEEMDEFLTAQHAEERNRQIASINPAMPDGGSGMNTADAQAILANHRATGRFDVLERHANEWRRMLREALDLRLANGLIRQEVYDDIVSTYQYYVPLRGAPAQIGDEDFVDPLDPSTTGLSSIGRGMPRALGRRSQAQNVTAQVGSVFEDGLRRVERNRIGQSFLNLTLAVNDRRWAEVVRPTRRVLVRDRSPGAAPGAQVVRTQHDSNWMSDPRNFGLYVNEPMTINGHAYRPGDLVVIRINNRRLYEGINTSAQQLRAFERGLRYVNNAFRFLTTGPGNPVFAPVNAARDIQTAFISNAAERGFRDSVQLVQRWLPAFADVFMQAWSNRAPTGDYADFIRAGGQQLYWRPNDLETKATDFDDLYERVQRRDPNDRGLARALLGWYPSIFAAAETATRLATYQQRIATGSSQEEAALAARDITVDFAKGGLAKPILNTWYMYLNAGLQGNVNLIRAVSRSVALAPSLFVMGFINAAMNRAMGGEDKERGQPYWDNLEPYQKSSAAHFYLPGGSGKRISVPLPYGYNVFYSMGVRSADAMFGRETFADAVSGIVVDGLNAFNPMGGSGITQTTSLASYALPTVIRPAAEIPANEKWDGSPIWMRQYDKFQAPDSQAPFDGTPAAYTAFAQKMNELTGGDEYESGLVDISPNTLQYLVGYYLSGAGRIVDRAYTLMTQPDPVTVGQIPGVRNFIGDDSQASMGRAYYRMREEMAPAMRRTEAAADPRLPDAARAAAGEGMTEFEATMAQWLEGYEEQLAEIRRAFKGASPEDRRAMVKLRAQIYDEAIRRRNELTDAFGGR